MKVLLLSPYPEKLAGTFAGAGDDVLATTGPIDVAYCRASGVDWIVSYGYRHMLRPPLLAQYRRRAVNLHVSYLPWNRGADPNFWAWFDGTPKGVTIHIIDEGLDTGDIVEQELVTFSGSETLASSYDALRRKVEALFDRVWPALRGDEIAGRRQEGPGTVHRSADKSELFERLSQGWDTPVLEVAALGEEIRLGAEGADDDPG